MKRMAVVLWRDLVSIQRDAILVYTIVALLAVALAARLVLLPSLGQAGVNVVLLADLAPALAAPLEKYVHVELAADRPALERRVLALDDTVGIAPAGDGGYTLVIQGNEAHDSRVLPAMALRHALGDSAWSAEHEAVAVERAPLQEWVGIFMGLGSLTIGGMILAFSIIEDKESRMMQALGVSPLGRKEYIAARSLLAVGFTLVSLLALIVVLGVRVPSFAQLLAVGLASSAVVALLGFVMGALSSNQIAGIANLKFGSLLVLAPAAVGMLLPERWAWVLYWLPSYWSFRGFQVVLMEQGGWAALTLPLLAAVGTSLVGLAAAYPWLRGRLDFARG